MPAYLVTHGRLAGVACGRLEVVPFLLADITATALLVHIVGTGFTVFVICLPHES